MAFIETTSAEETRRAGEVLGRCVRAGDVVALTGDLGAGKTVIAKGVAEGLGIETPVTSPTFNILVLHRGQVDLAHFDLYRLEVAAELEDIDFRGVLESGAVCLIEWGDRFSGELPHDILTVSITITGDESRRIAIDASGPASGAIAHAWIAAWEGGSSG